MPNFRSFSSERALILIEEGLEPPINAFVAVKRGNKWFSIRDDDLVSKRNFSLLSTLTIVSAKSVAATPTVTAVTLR